MGRGAFVVGLTLLAHRELAEVCDELGTGEGEQHRQDAQDLEPAAAEDLAIFACSFCDARADFVRPPARTETVTACVDCLLAAQLVFAAE